MRLVALTFLLLVIALVALPVFAQEGNPRIPDEFYRAKVLEVREEIEEFEFDEGEAQSFTNKTQVARVAIVSGLEKGKEVEVRNDITFAFADGQKLKRGDTVVIAKSKLFSGEEIYFFVDMWRLPVLGIAAAFFIGITIFIGRLRGFTSLVGLGLSVWILAQIIVPKIVSGANPLVVSLGGAFAIAVISIFLAHGFNARTRIAVLATLATLALATILALLAVGLARVFGTGSEEAFNIQIGPFAAINLRGLFLGAIILGALGILDDVTTTQVATVDELLKTDPRLSFSALYQRGLSVGREHIAALVNTLALAYVAASFPLFILLATNKVQPLWVLLNTEFLAEEIIRTLVGSSALVLAIPISTFLAAYFLSRKPKHPASQGGL